MGDVYMLDGKILSGLPNHAKDIVFDNTGTNLNSTNTEDAIKEVNSNLPQFMYAYQMTASQLAPLNTEQVTLTIPSALQNKTIINVIPVCANPQAHLTSYALITAYDPINKIVNLLCQGSGAAQPFAIFCLWIYKD